MRDVNASMHRSRLRQQALRFASIITLLLVLLSAFASRADSLGADTAGASGCATSSPTSGSYSVTICITSPSSGATLTGNATVTATVTVSGGTITAQRVLFYLNGNYVLTDYSSAYTFTLPTNRWADGSYTISAGATMRDGFAAAAASRAVIFSNGISATPVASSTFKPTSGRPANGAPFVVAAAGDGASGEAYAGKVSSMLKSINPNLFLYLGDVYERGSFTEFYNWYGTSSAYFSALRPITDPTVGNHEYLTSGASGYYSYWNNPPKYYSFNAYGWHFVSLNSNGTYVPAASGSAQYNWLQKDLAALSSNTCTIVFYHHPLYNIGPEGAGTQMGAIWSLMAKYGVDIVLNGHDHDYQRWKPLDANGNVSSHGITEIVVGTAGHGLQTFTKSDSRVAKSEDDNPGAFGVLLLTLHSTYASFSYQNTSGTVLDSGTIPCVSPATAATIPITSGPTNAATTLVPAAHISGVRTSSPTTIGQQVTSILAAAGGVVVAAILAFFWIRSRSQHLSE